MGFVVYWGKIIGVLENKMETTRIMGSIGTMLQRFVWTQTLKAAFWLTLYV